MNSNSSYFDNNFDNCRRDRVSPDSGRKEKRQQPAAIMKCSSPGAVNIPILADPGSTFTPTSLTVNTNGICNPCTRLDFTSNIIAGLGVSGTLTFQIFKQCRNQFAPVPVGPAFTYSRTVALTVGEANTFSFFVCDCDSCDNECCTYTVVITNQSAITVGLTINNATLSAITTSQANTSCNCNC